MHSLRKFARATQPITYPVQLMTGGGRGRGFHVIERIPWSDLSRLRARAEVWESLNCEYIRLASAYDNFYDYLGFLSPRMLEVTNALTAEIFRLRNLCRDLTDRLGRVRLSHVGGDSVGDLGRFLEQASKRDEQDRSSVHAILETS